MSIDENGSKNSKIQYDLTTLILGVYVILIGVIFPLVVKDAYFDILTVKYYFYCICTIGMVIMLFFYYILERKIKVRTVKGDGQNVNVKKLSKIDCFVLLFYFVVIISTVTSSYVYESFWGNEGRFTGAFLITWYVISYFCVSRFWNFKKMYLNLILIAGLIVCIIGITDYFNLDILGFKNNIVVGQKNIFTSTLGNINTYTAYVGMIMAISTVLYAKAETKFQMLLFYLCMIITFFAIIMGVSDNAYLSLFALFAFLPFYLFKNINGVKRYLIILATFLTVIQAIAWINSRYGDQVLGLDGLFGVLAHFSYFSYIVLAVWGIIGIWYLVDFKDQNDTSKECDKRIRRGWLGAIGLIFLSIIFVLYDCNIAGNVERYRAFSNYLVFNDDWGTHRGYIWRNAMECFYELPIWKKLVGFGPETFGILIMNKTAYNPYNELFDSAHNEYIHLLTTVGIAGLMAYLGILISFIKHGIKQQKNNPYGMAILFAVICYSVQAFVNLNVPIVTPIFWLLLGMGVAVSKEEK